MRGGGRFVAPTGDERGIHTRLLGRKLPPDLIGSFYVHFADSALEKLQERPNLPALGVLLRLDVAIALPQLP